jgi:thiamine-monophosphate kinase
VLVSEIGEFGLIKLLAEEFGLEYPPARDGTQRGLRVGLGDDAVVSERREGSAIWTTDTMVAGVHFIAGRTTWEDVGWKALAVNLSDIAAMGGDPDLALVTLMLPPEFRVDDAVALYRGLHDAAEAYEVTLGGGDIVRGPVFSVTVALSGWTLPARIGEPPVMTRNAAHPGDLVAVSGYLGDSAGGLQLLRDEVGFETEASVHLRLAHERPQPRVSLGKTAARSGIRCAIDVSDGLVQDLGHIATASNVEIRVDAVRIPLSGALHETFPGRALGMAISGGEDYELVLIAPSRPMDAVLDASDTTLTVIGEVVRAHAPHVAVVDETGREIPLRYAGWDHLHKA